MNLTVNNALELFVPIIMNSIKTKSETKGTDHKKDEKLSLPEQQFLLQKYDVSRNILQEYAETAVQFGLMTVFISALPISTLLAFIYNCFEIKLDAWKLLKVYQRPIPKIAEDWGAWEHVFSVLSIVGVITNGALICFTMKTLDGWSLSHRLWIFIGYQWTLFCLMYFISLIIPDESTEFKIQSERSQFIISKLIDRVPDDDEEAERRALLGPDGDNDDDNNNNPNNPNNNQYNRLATNEIDVLSIINLQDNPLKCEDIFGQDIQQNENLLSY